MPRSLGTLPSTKTVVTLKSKECIRVSCFFVYAWNMCAGCLLHDVLTTALIPSVSVARSLDGAHAAWAAF